MIKARIVTKIFPFLILLLITTISFTDAAIDPGPKETVSHLVEKIRSIKRPSDETPKLSPSDVAKNKKIYSEIN